MPQPSSRASRLPGPTSSKDGGQDRRLRRRRLDTASRESEAERLLTELETRLDAIVHERQTVAAQIAKASRTRSPSFETSSTAFGPLRARRPGGSELTLRRGAHRRARPAGWTPSKSSIGIRNPSRAWVRVVSGSSCALSSFARSARRRRLSKTARRFSLRSIC